MLGEELAVQALKLGATDYVLTERLSRIVSAVRGALREAQHRADRTKAEQTLCESEQRFRTIVHHASDPPLMHPEARKPMDLPRTRRDLLKRYGVAVGLPLLALVVRAVLPFPEGAGIYQLPLAAVVLSAWYGGRGPGWLASAIAVAGAMYLLPPAGSFVVQPAHALPLSISPRCACCSANSARHGAAPSRRCARARRAFASSRISPPTGTGEQDENLRFTVAMDEKVGSRPVSLGKTRWELPGTPLSASWDEHRAVLAARKPFRNFEYSRTDQAGATRYISVSGLPMFDVQGAFKGYDGVASDITSRKLAEAERQAHVWFLESMDRINRAMQGTNNVERMMSDVLDAVLERLACDRAWLLYPCDPDAPSWRAVMEHTRPEYPGAFALGVALPADADTAAIFAAAQASPGPVRLGAAYELRIPGHVAERFTIRSAMAMALCPKGDRPYLFGVHQCSHPRMWTNDEQRLFEDIGHRLTDALTSLVSFRGLRESEARLEAAQRVAHVGWWERDYATGHVSLSDEACRIFGVEPVDLPNWEGRWRSLIHPEDRDKAPRRTKWRSPAARVTTWNTAWCARTARCAWCTARVTSRATSRGVRSASSASCRTSPSCASRSAGSRRRSASRTSAGGSATTPPAAG